MTIFEASCHVPSTPEQVWHCLSRVAAWPDWLPTVQEVLVLDGENLRVGHRFRLRQPRLRPTIWTVSEVLPWRSFSWQSRAIGVTVTAGHHIEPLTDQSCRVRLRVAFRGPMARPAGWLAGTLTQDYLAQEAKALRAKMASLRAGPA